MKNRVSKLFSAIAKRVNVRALQDDFRKAGLVLVGAGYIGVIIDSDKISSTEGFVLLFTGIILWSIGLAQEEDGNDD